jgi:hypothetical protein
MPKKIVKPCPYLKICSTPGYWGEEKKDYIKNICKTNKHKLCTHKQSIDAHFEPMTEEARLVEFKRLNEYYLLKRIEDYVRSQWSDYLTNWILKEIDQKKSVQAVKDLCESNDREWLSQDILKMIEEWRI